MKGRGVSFGARAWSALALLVMAELLLAFPASAETTNKSLTKTGVAGSDLLIGHFSSTNSDCTPSGRTVARVSQAPAHGVVVTRQGLGYSFFPNNSACNGRKHPGVTVFFRPERGFTGHDVLALDVIFYSGNEMNLYYDITIK